MDNPTAIVPQANEYAYGPIADSYAQKYGIPSDVFRNLIRGISGFDPNFKGNNGDGRGIASLGFSGNNPNMPNPNDVGSSLDFAANMLSSLYKSSGSWDVASKLFTTGTPEETKAAQDVPDPNSWTAKIGAWFKSAGWTMLISAVGILLILGSVWVIVNSSENK